LGNGKIGQERTVDVPTTGDSGLRCDPALTSVKSY